MIVFIEGPNNLIPFLPLMDNKPSPGSRATSTTDRKTVEKNRRNQMKSLFSDLNSLLPGREVSGEASRTTSLPDQLDRAATYVKKLQIKLVKMKEKKEKLVVMGRSEKPNINMDVHESGSALRVALVTGVEYHQAVFNETIRVLHEEGVEVVNASFTVSDENVFHTIHCEVGESTSNHGASRVFKRLRAMLKRIEDI